MPDFVYGNLLICKIGETYGESNCLECCVVWKWNVDFTKREYSTTLKSIWNVDMEAYDESIVDWAQNKWRSNANGWHRKRNDGHSQKSTEEMVRSYPQTWFITENNVFHNLFPLYSQGEKVVEDQEQCSWIGYWRLRKIISVIDELKTLAQDSVRWCQWRWKPAIWAEYCSSSSSNIGESVIDRLKSNIATALLYLLLLPNGRGVRQNDVIW